MRHRRHLVLATGRGLQDHLAGVQVDEAQTAAIKGEVEDGAVDRRTLVELLLGGLPGEQRGRGAVLADLDVVGPPDDVSVARGEVGVLVLPVHRQVRQLGPLASNEVDDNRYFCALNERE